jgi:hypothetical protein
LADKSSDPFLYHTHVWVENAYGEVLPKFAPGYPALLAAGYKLFGDEGMFGVSPFMGGLALVAVFFLARLWGAGNTGAVLAAGCLAVGGMYQFYAGYLLSHVPSLCVVAWGMVFLWKWMRGGGPAWGVAAGLLLGFSVTIRHTNAVLALPVLVAVAGRLARPVRAWPALALLAGYAIFPLLLALYNQRYFGGYFSTGYQLTSEQSSFKWSYFLAHSRLLTAGLSSEALYTLFPLGLLGTILVGKWDERLARLGWFVPLYVVYATYYYGTAGGAYYRFMFATFPLFAAAAFMLIAAVGRDALARCLAMAVVTGLVVLHNAEALGKAARGDLYGRAAARLVVVGRALDETADADAVVLLSSRAKYAIGTRRAYRSYSLDVFLPGYGHGMFRAPHRRRPPKPKQQELRRRRLEHFYRKHSRDQLREMKRDLVREHLEGGRQVVYAIPVHEAHRERQELGEAFRLEPLHEFDAPAWGRWGIYQAALKIEN